MTDQSTIPTWPRIEALTRDDGSGEVTINGTSHPIETTNAADARNQIIQLVTRTATTIGRAVHLSTSGPDGDWRLLVHPDGTIVDATADPGAKATKRATTNTPRPIQQRTDPTPSAAPRAGDVAIAPPTHPPATSPAGTAASAPVSVPPPTTPSAEVAPSITYSTEHLLKQLRPEERLKATSGWRSWFRLPPAKRERELLEDLARVRTQYPRAVTVMVANPKGGGGKTPTSLLVAGELGVARGGGVVVWDNNELRGNARDRSYFPHSRSVADLLEAADRLERPDASFTELAFFLAHQTHGKYFVLSSDPSGRVVMDQKQVKRVHRILARFFEIIIIDTGNNEKAPNWLAARDLADCLIVPMKWRQDSILVANRMLATMADTDTPLLQRTLLVGTNGPGDSQSDARAAVYERFSDAHAITEIRTDPHIHAGSIIDRSQLAARTQRAGLRTAAIVARLAQESAT